jgi:hypothetical protein
MNVRHGPLGFKTEASPGCGYPGEIVRELGKFAGYNHGLWPYLLKRWIYDKILGS